MESRLQGEGVVFVVPGDLHLEEPDRENHLVARQVVDEVNRLIRPDFVQFIGDNVQHARECEFQLFRELTARLTCPHFSLVGDHDRNGSDIPEEFIQFVGDPYGSTELRGFRFIRVNSQEVRPAGFTEEQLDWITEEFQAAQSKQQRVVIFQHNYPFKVFEQFAGPGINRWRSLLDAYPPVAVVCGHTHYAQVANDGRHAYIATRSIGDPEGGPAGYLLGVVAGDDFAVKHRTVAESARQPSLFTREMPCWRLVHGILSACPTKFALESGHSNRSATCSVEWTSSSGIRCDEMQMESGGHRWTPLD